MWLATKRPRVKLKEDAKQHGAGRSALHVDDHLFVNVSVANHGAELVERYLAILVAVGEEDRLVDDLLQLRVFQVVAHHHLEDLEELSVGDEPVIVHVVDAESEAQLRQLVALHAELRHALDELLEVHLSIAVSVEDVNNALHQRVLLQLRQRHELVDGQGARVVQVQLAETLAQPPDLIGVEVGTELHGN